MEKVYNMSVDGTQHSEDNTSAVITMDDGGVPHLSAFRKDDVMLIIGEEDERLTGFLVDFPGIICEGNNFREISLELHVMKEMAAQNGILDSFRAVSA